MSPVPCGGMLHSHQSQRILHKRRGAGRERGRLAAFTQFRGHEERLDVLERDSPPSVLLLAGPCEHLHERLGAGVQPHQRDRLAAAARPSLNLFILSSQRMLSEE